MTQQSIEHSLWTAEQTAQLLSCSPQHVLRLAVTGMIPAVDIAPSSSKHRMWRFRPEAVEQWLKKREQTVRSSCRN